MDRRAFFKRAMGKTTEAVLDEADRRLAARTRWIRPPFALPELDFLLACTRCGACAEACPYEVVFFLSARLGPKLVNTPALDLLNRGCHLCDDWPCVAACEPGALHRPEDEQGLPGPVPRMAAARIDAGACLPYLGPECGACQGSCPVEGALNWRAERPSVDPEYCTGCGLCREACIAEPKAIRVEPLRTTQRTTARKTSAV